MFTKTNIETILIKGRKQRLRMKDPLEEVATILRDHGTKCDHHSSNLKTPGPNTSGRFCIDLLESDRIFHLNDIEKICVNYRLRFLDSHFFKGSIPEEAIAKIRRLEEEHNIKLQSFKIMAPSKLLKLENADDPLLFSPLGNDYYYLIHKWGKDLHSLRRFLVWPYKTFENLVFTIFILCIILTAITPIGLLSKTHGMQEYLLLFLFIFKGIAGTVLFYGFAKGKNFNTAIWNSKYYNA